MNTQDRYYEHLCVSNTLSPSPLSKVNKKRCCLRDHSRLQLRIQKKTLLLSSITFLLNSPVSLCPPVFLSFVSLCTDVLVFIMYAFDSFSIWRKKTEMCGISSCDDVCVHACAAHHCSSCWVLCSLSSAACSVLYAPRSCPLSALTSLSGSSTLLCSSALSTSTCSLSSSARHLFASDRSLISDSWELSDKQNDTSLLESELLILLTPVWDLLKLS